MTRRPIVILLIIILITICYVLYICSSLIALLFEDGLRDSVNFATIMAKGNLSSSHPIPKIIHQTWKNDKIPEQWQIAQFTWFCSIVQGMLII